jgi:hypothetical protein
MRSIQRDRMSLFLLRRSLYEYCSAFSTLSLAILIQFFALPLNPLANLKILPLFISKIQSRTKHFAIYLQDCNIKEKLEKL